MDAPKAIWNPARDVWESPTSIDLFSEHSDVFSATWPTSGSMRSGQVFALPTLAHLTNDSGSSSSRGLPTPRASDSKGGAYPMERPESQDNLETRITRLLPTTTAKDAAASGGSSPANVTLTDAAARTRRGTVANPRHLPTPVAGDAERTSEHYVGGNPTLLGALLPTPTTRNAQGNAENNRGDLLLPGAALSLLPTPNAALALKGGTQSPEKRRAGGHQPGLDDVAMTLMPTPQVADAEGGHKSRSGARSGELLLPGLAVEIASSGGRIVPPLSDGSE